MWESHVSVDASLAWLLLVKAQAIELRVQAARDVRVLGDVGVVVVEYESARDDAAVGGERHEDERGAEDPTRATPRPLLHHEAGVTRAGIALAVGSRVAGLVHDLHQGHAPRAPRRELRNGGSWRLMGASGLRGSDAHAKKILGT